MAEYRVYREYGPDHQKTFEVEVWHSGQRLASSEGRKKKEAEQAAAKRVLQSLELSGGKIP
jgi:ribonuclease-3